MWVRLPAPTSASELMPSARVAILASDSASRFSSGPAMLARRASSRSSSLAARIWCEGSREPRRACSGEVKDVQELTCSHGGVQGHGRTLAEFSVSALATARRMVERVCGNHIGVHKRQGVNRSTRPAARAGAVVTTVRHGIAHTRP